MMTSLGTCCKIVLKYHSHRLGTASFPVAWEPVWPSSVFPGNYMFSALRQTNNVTFRMLQCALLLKASGFCWLEIYLRFCWKG